MKHFQSQERNKGYHLLTAIRTHRFSTRWANTCTIAVAGLLALGYVILRLRGTIILGWTVLEVVPQNHPEARKNYSWSDITPSKHLQWFGCYDGVFECARLDLPLNWMNPSETQRVYLGVIRSQAKSRADYRGPVFVNPGGPGGSGVNFLVRHADELQAIVGYNHDIISFDPRGVGASVPRIDCWGSSHTRHDWERVKIDVLDAHPGLAFDAFANADAFSRQCEAHIEATTPGLLQHLSTASHARDMLEMSEQAGYPKLKYWGISYGSILGGTFAAMFPDRVERLVSDGNVDYSGWYQLNHTNFFEDTDSIMEAFFHYCHKAGPSKCAFYSSSPSAIEARFFKLLNRLKTSPVLIPARSVNGTMPPMPELVTYSKLQLLIRTVLYRPYYMFSSLAQAMTALEERDGLPFYEMAGEWEAPLKSSFCSRNRTSPTDPQNYDNNWDDAFRAITCSDGEPFTDTPESFADYAKTLQNISKFAGAAYTHFKLGCVGRQIRPQYRFPAPWKVETGFPILFIGNIGDNVTPLSSARKNSRAFPGSVVLVQNSWGHASIAAPSTCTAKAIHSYFQNGTLPENETHCEQDFDLFEEPIPITYTNGKDSKLSHAIHELSRKISVFRGVL